MTKLEYEAIKARCESATPGPWSSALFKWHHVYKDLGGGRIATIIPYDYDDIKDNSPANAEFIAHAREDIPALLKALEKAEKTLRHAGYTDEGGEMWKPPLGPRPDFSLVDRYKARVEALENQLSESEKEWVDWLHEKLPKYGRMRKELALYRTRADALERALRLAMKDCQTCVFIDREGGLCSECSHFDNDYWQFDEARFTVDKEVTQN